MKSMLNSYVMLSRTIRKRPSPLAKFAKQCMGIIELHHAIGSVNFVFDVGSLQELSIKDSE